jgi:drug/metabolite transporter (DMT)-like permease
MSSSIPPALFGLLAALLWGTVDFVSRRPSRKIGYYQTAAYVQIIGFLTLGIYVLVSPNEYPVIGHYTLLLLAVNFMAGAFNFIGFLFLYRGFSSGIMSIVAPISGSYPIVTITLSISFLGAVVGQYQAIGIAIVLGGIILASVNLSEIQKLKSKTLIFPSDSIKLASEEQQLHVRKKSRIARGSGSALVSCVSFGTLYFFLGFVTNQTDFIVPVLFMRLSAAVISCALLVPLGFRFVRPDLHSLAIIVFIGIFDTLGYLSFDAGILSAGSSLPIVATLSGLVGVFTIVLARIFYKEKLGALQWLGIAAITAGVSVVLYFS